MAGIGRGGLGNIQNAQQATEQKRTDVEANWPSADNISQDSLVPERRHDTKHEVTRIGRGGSGNYYHPSDLTKSGHSGDVLRSNVAKDGPLLPDSGKSTPDPSLRVYGRGGAGNVGIVPPSQKDEEARRRQQSLTAAVEEQVTRCLALPPKAKLGHINPS